MGIIIWLIVGGICGWLASMIMRTDAQQGILLNIVVGHRHVLANLGLPGLGGVVGLTTASGKPSLNPVHAIGLDATSKEALLVGRTYSPICPRCDAGRV